MVKVSVDISPTRIGLGAKSFEMVGGKSAVSVSLAEPVDDVFVPVCAEEIIPLMLGCGPAVVAVTSTRSVQKLPAAIDPPLRLIEVLPAVAPLTLPPQELLNSGLVATRTPSGKLSEKETPLKATLLGLVAVNVSVETPPTAMERGENDFLSSGASGTPQPVNSMLSIRNVALAFPTLLPEMLTRNRVVVAPGVTEPVRVVHALRGIGFALMIVPKAAASALAWTLTVILRGAAQFPVGVGLTAMDINNGPPA